MSGRATVSAERTPDNVQALNLEILTIRSAISDNLPIENRCRQSDRTPLLSECLEQTENLDSFNGLDDRSLPEPITGGNRITLKSSLFGLFG